MNIFSINLTLAANVDDANGSLAEAIAEILPALIEEFDLDETGIELIISSIENQVRDHSSIMSACFWLFQAHPPTNVSTNSTVTHQKFPFSDPTHPPLC